MQPNWWINITVPEKRGRTFLKKQGRKLKIQGTNFKICLTYFLPKKEACVSISYKGPFFAQSWIKSGNVPHDYATQNLPYCTLADIKAQERRSLQIPVPAPLCLDCFHVPTFLLYSFVLENTGYLLNLLASVYYYSPTTLMINPLASNFRPLEQLSVFSVSILSAGIPMYRLISQLCETSRYFTFSCLNLTSFRLLCNMLMCLRAGENTHNLGILL